MLSDSRPDRRPRGKSHIPPNWVGSFAQFFITINCRHRHVAQLTIGELPNQLFDAVRVYREKCRWNPEIVLLMPDHLHGIFSVEVDCRRGLQGVIQDWKRYTCRAFGVDWQRDFFDHRIRNEADRAEKWNYIRENPVRKGLVTSFDKWQHVWFPDRQGWATAEFE